MTTRQRDEIRTLTNPVLLSQILHEKIEVFIFVSRELTHFSYFMEFILIAEQIESFFCLSKFSPFPFSGIKRVIFYNIGRNFTSIDQVEFMDDISMYDMSCPFFAIQVMEHQDAIPRIIRTANHPFGLGVFV
ncbi:hypothetical protein [Mesobacillus zeae]|nr:hypothetical protein [Mesobacillus zeae]